MMKNLIIVTLLCAFASTTIFISSEAPNMHFLDKKPEHIVVPEDYVKRLIDYCEKKEHKSSKECQRIAQIFGMATACTNTLKKEFQILKLNGKID